MQVFDLSMKILKKNAPVMSIYFGIFILVSIMMMSSSTAVPQGSFQMAKSQVVLLTQEDTPLVQGLKEALSDHAVFITMEDEPQLLRDALYYRRVDYILRIPVGFTEDFLAGKDVLVQKTTIPNAVHTLYIDLAINKYLNTARTYGQLLPALEDATRTGYILEDLSQETQVVFEGAKSAENEGGTMQYFFNYLSYTFMFVLIMGVSILILAFNKPTIKRRNACSPIPSGKANFQLFLSILVFALMAWVILVSLSLFFSRDELGNANTLYYVFNSLLFAATTAGISFLIANLVKGREAIIAVANIVTLGSCFISGVFVPQELISPEVLKIASFLPTYWFVRGNRLIATMTSWTDVRGSGLQQVLLIQIAFALAFFVLALVVGKRKRTALEEA